MTAGSSARWLWLLAGGALLTLSHGGRAAADAFEKRLAHAEQLVRAGQFAAAEKEYLELLRSNPNSYVLHNDLGAVYLSEQKYETGCREFTQAAALNPRLAAIPQNLGSCYFLSNMFAKAADALRRARDLDPQDLKTRYLLGYSLLTLGRLDEAQRELEFVRVHKPGDENTLFSLVRLHRQKRQEEQARAAFRELVAAHPDSVFVHILMGESYDAQEKPAEAMEEFKKAIALAPEMPKLHFDLGFLLWGEKQADAAKAEFTKVLELDPHFAAAAFYLGDMALSENHYREAITFFERAVADNPRCLDAYVELGKAYARLAEYQKGLAQFRAADRLDPHQPDVHFWLATTYRQLGDEAKSRAEMETYQSLIKDTPAQERERQQARRVARTCSEQVQ